MTAIDMKTRQIAWQVPLDTVEDTGPLGFKMGLKAPIGMPTIMVQWQHKVVWSSLLRLKTTTYVPLILQQVKSCGKPACQWVAKGHQ